VTAGGVTERRSVTVTVQNNAEFSLTGVRQNVSVGETARVRLAVSNRVNDEAVSAKLELNTSVAGIAVSGVSGPGVVGTRSTEFVTVEAGETRALRITLGANEPGTYHVGGEVVYYYAGQEIRRRTAVEPMTIRVTASNPDTTRSNGSVTRTVSKRTTERPELTTRGTATESDAAHSPQNKTPTDSGSGDERVGLGAASAVILTLGMMVRKVL
jgi:hypothetical protein